MIARASGGARAARTACVVLAFVLSVQAAAGERDGVEPVRLTLEGARERARAASPRLEAAREAVAAARGAERQAGAFLNPSLVYVHEQTSRSGATNREDIALVQQPVEIAGQRGLRQEVARLRREVAEAQLAAAEQTLDFEVSEAFARAVATERKATHAREVAEAFARAREISAERRERGDVSGYEDRRTALETARYAALRAEAERDRRTARAALASLLAASPEGAPVLTAPLADPLEAPLPRGDLDRLREAALARHPAIRAAELARRTEQAEARLARRERVPDPIFGLGYKRERMAEVSGSWDGFAAQATLPLPLWDRRAGAVEAADAEARRGAAELRRARRLVALEVEQTFRELEAASEQLDAIGPQLGSEAEAALRAARTAYDEGEIALVEWLDAVRAY
jgi:outer membrane protein, heavy metal efflux system